MKHLYSWILTALLVISGMTAKAQSTFRNTAFQSGELLSYNLYFNWKFIWVKAGTATFSISEHSYDGIPAYCGSLVTKTSNRVDKFFVMRDTLLCYNSLDMAPLYYRKGAQEGSRYTVDEVFYKYEHGKTYTRQHRRHGNGTHSWDKNVYTQMVYDMMSIFMRARSFNPTSWKQGYSVDFPIVDGNGLTPAKLSYQGKVNVKADNGVTYRCLKLSYLENADKKGYKGIVDFFVTDDANHVPVRLDMHLRFGSAKAFLTNMQNIRNKIASEVK